MRADARGLSHGFQSDEPPTHAGAGNTEKSPFAEAELLLDASAHAAYVAYTTSKSAAASGAAPPLRPK
jgi:hypothetical protein